MDDTVIPATTGQAAGEQSFDAYYFANCCGMPYRRDAHWLNFFGNLADRIVGGIQPRRVLDAGCALGILVEALRARGVDAQGVDLSSYAIEQVDASMRPFCRLGSIADEFPERYDLIVSIEVLEHMPVRDGEAAIANICRHTDDVLFSSTPNDHREPSHVNVQPGEYWAELFAGHGFFRDVEFDASFLTPWAVRFRRRADPLPRIVRDYERQFVALAASRNDSRAFATDLQREHGRVAERLAAAETEGDGLRQALEAERAAQTGGRATMQHLINQLGELTIAVDHQRSALLESRLALDQEREALLESAGTGGVAALRDAIEHSHANLTRKIVELDTVTAQLQVAQARTAILEHELAHARQTIHLMEQSVFWRARRPWAALSRVLGRST
jgi:SAM-dependent methyltransferase